MILLGRIERRCGLDRGDDRLGKPVRLVQLTLRRLGQPALLRVAIENDGAVLGAVVAEGGVHGQRVDVVPVDVEQALVRDFGRIVYHLDRLGMSRVAPSHFL